jgi:molybdenum cofactor cytidylyltransferase
MPSTTDLTMASRPESEPTGAQITAILLAAGQSTRMGARNKLLLDVGGQPMVRHVAETLLASHVDAVIAVLGHEPTAVAEALGSLPLRIVINRDHASGQMSSVRAGIQAIDGDPAAIVVALADQPALEPADIDFLIEAFLALPEPKILIPVRGRQRGNPIVLPGAERHRLLDGGFDFGCRNLIERHPEAVSKIEVPNPHYVQDIDTPAAYDAWVESHFPRRAKDLEQAKRLCGDDIHSPDSR